MVTLTNLAVVAVEGCAGDDGGGHDDDAEHHQAVDQEVLQAVPPDNHSMSWGTQGLVSPWPERLLSSTVAEDPAHESRPDGSHGGPTLPLCKQENSLP